ncbi:MAG: TetR/AcrR family transcriptional regulator [Bacteroidota bacterium]
MSEKRQARFEMLRQSSKERIETAALELFAHNGYGHTSISQIAKAAGISKGLMYNYYESKEELLKAIVRKGTNFGDRLMEEGAELAKKGPEELLKFLIEASFEEVQKNVAFWKLLTSLAFQEDVLKTMSAEMDIKKQEHLNTGKTIFSQLGYPNPEVQAMLFGATMDGVFMHYVIAPNEYPLDDVKKLIVEQFCKNFEK